MSESPVPAVRIRALNAAPLRPERRFVLYWMVAARRTRHTFALEHALALAGALERPLVVLEALRADYPYASARLHAFVLDGMSDNARAFAATPVRYFPYVEPEPGAGRGLVAALGAHACAVVSDDWPCLFVPRMQAAAARALDVRLEVVDGNGLYPMHDTARVFTTAHSFRIHLHKVLALHLEALPCAEPLRTARPCARAALPRAVTARWPASAAVLAGVPPALALLPIDQGVGRSLFTGGSRAGDARLARFVRDKLARYAEARDEPECDGTSLLSPYLHFGHVSTHALFAAIARAEGFRPAALARERAVRAGSRSGFWRMSRGAEAFLEQLVTWRELAFNLASHRPGDYARFGSLPAWARATLAKHARDPRPHLYTCAALEAAETHDELWNATQRQLVREGWFHGYLRMLWGKKILEWSPSPEEALARMDFLMSKYALDGRDPVSYAGFFWVLGRYDRAWGPERPIFGTVRYMSSANTARKHAVRGFLARYPP